MTLLPRDLTQTIEEILDRLAALERTSQLPSSSIGEGGLSVRDGGQIRIEDASAIVRLLLEVGAFRVFDSGGAEQITVTDDGSIAIRNSGRLQVLDASAVVRLLLEVGAFRVFDSAGTEQITIGDDGKITIRDGGTVEIREDGRIEIYVSGILRVILGGSGLTVRNHLGETVWSQTLVVASNEGEGASASVTSGTYTPVGTFWAPFPAAFGDVRVLLSIPSGTTADLRLVTDAPGPNLGAVIAEVTGLDSSVGLHHFQIVDLLREEALEDPTGFTVEARRASGTGTVGVTLRWPARFG